MAKKKSSNTTDLTDNQEPMAYDYIQLLGLITKYGLDDYDTRVVAEIVYDYLDKNWRW